jgi:hypothetical protein
MDPDFHRGDGGGDNMRGDAIVVPSVVEVLHKRPAYPAFRFASSDCLS